MDLAKPISMEVLEALGPTHDGLPSGAGNKVKRFGSWEASKQLTKPSNHLVVARGRPFDFVTGARRYVGRQ